MKTRKNDETRKHELDGKKVMIIRGRHRFAAGRVIRNSAFMARGHLTLMIRTKNDALLCATPSQVEAL